MRSRWILAAALLALCGPFVLTGCEAPQIKMKPIPVSANPTDEAGKLESELLAARQQQVDVLSPAWFKKAEKSLSTAQNEIQRRGAIETISSNLSRGRGELEKAKEMAEIARTVIPDAIKARDMARVAGAPNLGRDYTTAEGHFLDLTSEIEDNDVKYAQRNQQKVVDEFRALEIRAIKDTTLGEVRDLIAQAEKEDADDYAPAILKDAKAELGTVDAFIEKNPYATEQMLARAKVARFKAGRLLQLTRESTKLDDMKPIDIALRHENALHQITEVTGAPDMRDQPPEVQVDNLVGVGRALVADRNFLDARTRALVLQAKELKEQKDAEAEAMRKAHSDEIAALNEKNQTEQFELTRKYEEELSRVRSEHADAITALFAQHEGEIAAVQGRHEEELTLLGIEHERVLGAFKSESDTQVRALMEQVVLLEGESREEKERLEQMLEEQRAERARVEAENKAERERLETERRAEREKAEMERKAALAAAESARKAELEKADAERRAEIERVEAERRAELERLAAERRATEERLAAERREAEEKLAAEMKFNQQYEQVQALFNEDEAECYKQGLKMVVRLRSMNFPVGQSIILPENYALLGKVQRAIRIFDNPIVTIEGHTDSTGPLEMNNHLSEKRAEAVKTYMLTNGMLNPQQVMSIGYGPSRPLAPNTSAEGRAQNRRIDVVITPAPSM